MTDEEFRLLISHSPQQAYRKLFDEYVNYVYAIVFSKLRSCACREDIDDCVGEIFSEIFISYKGQNGFDGDLKGYIRAVARNKSCDLYRQLVVRNGKTVSPYEDEIQNIPSEARVDETIEKSEVRRILLDSISSLGEPNATIIFQKYFCGRKSGEIAGMVSLSPTAVRMRCRRAVKRLKNSLGKDGITL